MAFLHVLSGRDDDILQRLAADEAVDVACHLAPAPRDHPFGPAGSNAASSRRSAVRERDGAMDGVPVRRRSDIAPDIQRRSANAVIA